MTLADRTLDDRDRLTADRSVLIERLKLRSDDLEATRALQTVDRALVRTPYPDGPWRWAHHLDPRRVRATERRRSRRARRRRTGPRRAAARHRTRKRNRDANPSHMPRL